MNTFKILTKAAELGRKHGVAKGKYFDNETGTMCINGLIGAAILGRPIDNYTEYNDMVNNNEQYDAALRVVSTVIFGGWRSWSSLANWNNHKATSAEVISYLDEAAVASVVT